MFSRSIEYRMSLSRRMGDMELKTVDEAATWICVVRIVFLIKNRTEGVHFFFPAQWQKKKKKSLAEGKGCKILKKELTSFQ